MRYVVLLRYGLWRWDIALCVRRAADGSISCAEPLREHREAGMTWGPSGLYTRTTDAGAQVRAQRTPLAGLTSPEVAYSVAGERLLDGRLPAYDSDVAVGATVQVSAHAVLEEPQRVTLQLVLAPTGQAPVHRETVGDRRFDDGQPNLWIVLTRSEDDPAARLVASRIHRRPPRLRLAERL